MKAFARSVFVFTMVALLTACGGAAAPNAQQGGGSSPGKPKVLRLAEGLEANSLDPALLENPVAIQPAENLWDPLTLLDPNDYSVKPLAAKEWNVSSDGLVWTFKLRTDAKFSNGDPVTAKDFKYALNRIAWPETKSLRFSELEGIKGAQDVNKGTTKDISGIKVVDDYTLEFDLTEPEAYFLPLTSMWFFSPISQKVVEQYGEQWATPGKIVTNGPFLLKSWDRATKMVLEANPNYYGGKPKIDQIEINIVKDPATAMLQYENGELDVVDINDTDYQRVQKDPKLSKEMNRKTMVQARWLAFNLAKPPFNNQKLREAIAYSIDRKKIVNLAFSDTVEPACQEVPPGLISDKPAFCWPDPDPNKAKQLLAEAGYPPGTPPPAVKLSWRSVPNEVRAAETMTQQIKTATGWDIPVDALTLQNFSAVRKNGNPDKTILMGTWGVDYADAQDWFDPLYTTKAGFNYSDMSDPQFDALVKKANGLTDQKERIKLYTQAEQMLLDKMYVVPLWISVANWLAKPYVHGFTYSMAYWPTLKDMTMD